MLGTGTTLCPGTMRKRNLCAIAASSNVASIIAKDAPLIGDQNGFDKLRRIEKIDVNPPGAIVKDIAEFARPAAKDSQRVRAAQREIPDEKMRPGARWACNAAIGHLLVASPQMARGITSKTSVRLCVLCGLECS